MKMKFRFDAGMMARQAALVHMVQVNYHCTTYPLLKKLRERMIFWASKIAQGLLKHSQLPYVDKLTTIKLMKVKTIKYSDRPEYTVVIPEDSSVEELSDKIQTAISKLGKPTSERIIELDTTLEANKDTIEKLNSQGAHLSKVSVSFEEIE
jgi:hypothetical protein